MVNFQETLIKTVKNLGFLPFDQLMQIALTDESQGYYIHKNPFTNTGDFTTSPQLSQVFGELLGLFLAEVWLTMGQPTKLNLVELGGGSGLLIADILRTTKKVEGFHKALSLHFIEINQPLKALAQQKLQEYATIPKTWYSYVEQLQLSEITIVYSNEFFDAIPLKQYCYQNQHFYELGVTCSQNHDLQLTFMKTLSQPALALPCHFQENAIYETSPLTHKIFQQLIDIIKRVQGVILTIDYGYINSSCISSLRGFKNQQLLNVQEVLHHITNADITYNVNFNELQNLAKENSVATYNILTQHDFLEDLGFSNRVATLANNILDSKKKELFLANNNKIINQQEMGNTFKVMALTKGLPYLPVFYKPTIYEK
ncbi:SAM-dependent methyltransferase [Candidatus Hepatincola sp. Av]